jgi:hypothetical protein
VAWRIGVLVVVLAAVGVIGVLVGTPRRDDTPPTLGANLLQETFARRDSASSLGTARPGVVWHAVAGTWGTMDGSAYVSAPTSSNNIAIVSTRSSRDTIAVTLTRVVNDAGLVFWYRNQANYWMIVASPKFSVWALRRVTDGKAERVADTGLAPTGDDTRVTVRVSPHQIEFWTENARRISGVSAPRTVVVSGPASASGTGLIAVDPGAERARFTNFVVSR